MEAAPTLAKAGLSHAPSALLVHGMYWIYTVDDCTRGPYNFPAVAAGPTLSTTVGLLRLGDSFCGSTQ